MLTICLAAGFQTTNPACVYQKCELDVARQYPSLFYCFMYGYVTSSSPPPPSILAHLSYTIPFRTVLTVKEYTLSTNVRREADSSGPPTPNPDSTPTTSDIKDDEDVKEDVAGIDLEAQKAAPSPDNEKVEEEEGITMSEVPTLVGDRRSKSDEELTAEKGSR